MYSKIIQINVRFQEILDRVRLIRFPPVVVFMFVFLYGLLASYVIQQKETWSYVESTYFTFISILTVGRCSLFIQQKKYYRIW